MLPDYLPTTSIISKPDPKARRQFAGPAQLRTDLKPGQHSPASPGPGGVRRTSWGRQPGTRNPGGARRARPPWPAKGCSLRRASQARLDLEKLDGGSACAHVGRARGPHSCPVGSCGRAPSGSWRAREHRPGQPRWRSEPRRRSPRAGEGGRPVQGMSNYTAPEFMLVKFERL